MRCGRSCQASAQRDPLGGLPGLFAEKVGPAQRALRSARRQRLLVDHLAPRQMRCWHSRARRPGQAKPGPVVKPAGSRSRHAACPERRGGAGVLGCAASCSTRTAPSSIFTPAGRASYRELGLELAGGDAERAAAMLAAGGMDPESGRVQAGSVLAAGNTIDIARLFFPELDGAELKQDGRPHRRDLFRQRHQMLRAGARPCRDAGRAGRDGHRHGRGDQRRHGGGQGGARRARRREAPAACLRLRFGGAAEAGAGHGARLRGGDRRAGRRRSW